MAFGRIESEYESDFNAWKATPTPQTTGRLLRRLQPSIDRGISAHVGRNPGPNIRGHARKLTIGALRTYDPHQARLSTHVINHLQGLKRVNRTSNQIMRVPERVMLDRNRVYEAEAQLEDQLGRPATTAELADFTGLSTKRLAYINTYRNPIAEGQLATGQGSSGEEEGFAPGIQQGPTSGHLDLVYGDLGPVNQNIMEWTLGLHGKPKLSNQQIAARLRLTPGAISQRKAQIQAVMDRTLELYTR